MSAITSEILERFRRLSTPAVADTKHSDVRVPHPAIKPLHSDCVFAGTARTVKIDPTEIWAPVATLDRARDDEVIVIDVGDCIDEAVWGELLSKYAASKGVVGAVTNGAVRDISRVRELGFPLFSRARTPLGPSGSSEVDSNVPVTVGETLIDSGDLILGDESGLVVVAPDAAEEVLADAEAITETEREVETLMENTQSLERAFERAGM